MEFVAGFVISSAPVVLLPLMVVSAIGLACSVPCGIFLASYVVTQKLMSKLLPIPSNIPEEKYGGEEARVEGDNVVENQEEELIRRAEMKPESDEKVNEEEKSSKEIAEICKRDVGSFGGKLVGRNKSLYESDDMTSTFLGLKILS